MIGDKPNPRPTQLSFSGIWFDGISWGYSYQTVMQFNSLGQESRPRTGRGDNVKQAFVEQVSFVGSVKRDKVAINVDSNIWPKLSP